MSKQVMDKRCPLNKKEFPTTWCHLAVIRLKAISNAGGSLSEADEAKLPGCPWFARHSSANYCFFKYINEFTGENNLQDVDIAHMLMIPLDEVKAIESRAISAFRMSEMFEDLKEAFGDENIIEDSSDDDQSIYD